MLHSLTSAVGFMGKLRPILGVGGLTGSNPVHPNPSQSYGILLGKRFFLIQPMSSQNAASQTAHQQTQPKVGQFCVNAPTKAGLFDYNHMAFTERVQFRLGSLGDHVPWD